MVIFYESSQMQKCHMIPFTWKSVLGTVARLWPAEPLGVSWDDQPQGIPLHLGASSTCLLSGGRAWWALLRPAPPSSACLSGDAPWPPTARHFWWGQWLLDVSSPGTDDKTSFIPEVPSRTPEAATYKPLLVGLGMPTSKPISPGSTE